ncbi:hypothetical protein PR048_000398 [Dryococelus australis]|uniref:Uncharacterized protein n=1 Tax=Dryococelus australis TaxID=614101 RepID=A0ABQ9IGT2_9NEOP|nr:hypothetical protein PR048_000398 [Dryococelus australis]
MLEEVGVMYGGIVSDLAGEDVERGGTVEGKSGECRPPLSIIVPVVPTGLPGGGVRRQSPIPWPRHLSPQI